MLTLYLSSLIGCMFIGSFAIYFSYLNNEQKRVAHYRRRSMQRRRPRPPAAPPRQFVPYAMLEQALIR